MTRKRGNRKGKGGNTTKIHSGRCPINVALTAASAGGAFVVTRVEVDTLLCDSLTKLGQVFSQWKVNKLDVHYVPIVGTTTKGLCGIGFLRDPQASSPSSTSTAIQLLDSHMDSIWKRGNLNIKCPGKWYFTRDVSASTEDRLEMPGDIIIWTDNTDTAQITGVVYIDFAFEFKGFGNATVYPSPLLKQPEAKSPKETNNNNVPVKSADDEAEMNSLLLSMYRRITRLQAARKSEPKDLETVTVQD